MPTLAVVGITPKWPLCTLIVITSLLASIFQSFTRLAEQVLAANRKDLDLLRMSVNDELDLSALEEEEGLCDRMRDDQQKGCWC